VLRCAITGRLSSDQPSIVVKLELMRSVAENSRKQYVEIRHSVQTQSLRAFSVLSPLGSMSQLLRKYFDVADLSIGVSRGPFAITLVLVGVKDQVGPRRCGFNLRARKR
jgi:hypothetical protein